MNVILVGNVDEVNAAAAKNGFDVSKAEILDPETYAGMDEMVNKMVELRKGKMSEEDCRAALKKGNYFGTMLVKMGKADALLGGATYSTADTVRPSSTLPTRMTFIRSSWMRRAAASWMRASGPSVKTMVRRFSFKFFKRAVNMFSPPYVFFVCRGKTCTDVIIIHQRERVLNGEIENFSEHALTARRSANRSKNEPFQPLLRRIPQFSLALRRECGIIG